MKRRWIVVACAAMLAVPAGATTLARMNLGQLTGAATAVVRARCMGNTSGWQGGEIWTLSQFETLETLKGTLPAQFTVRLIGGQAGGIESIVAGVPRFRPGEEVVLFLSAGAGGTYGVTAWVEGTFRVRRGAGGKRFLTQESSSGVAYDHATRQFHTDGIHGMPLDVFRQRLQSLTGRGATGARQ